VTGAAHVVVRLSRESKLDFYSINRFQTVGTGESRPSVLFPAEVLGFIHIMGDIGI